MSIILTESTILEELKKTGTLAELLDPEYFAEPGQVAERLAEKYVKSGELKPTQLRKIFHALKEKERSLKGKNDEEGLDPGTKAELRLFIPELAYACGRKLIPKDFYELMTLCLSSSKLQRVGDLRILMRFLEAVLAYHKYHEKIKGGR